MGKIVDISSVLLELGLSDSVTDEERAIVNVAINKAEGAVIRYLQYDPVKRTRTEYYPRMDFTSRQGFAVWESSGTTAFLRRESEVATNELQIQHLPIRSITTLAVDFDARFDTQSGAFASETEKVEGTDFWPVYDGVDDDDNKICRDGIIRSIGTWPSQAGSVKLVYVAGYSIEELHGQKNLVDASPIVESVIAEAVRKSQKVLLQKKKAGVGFTAGPFTGERLGDYSYTIDASVSKNLFGSTFTLMPETIQALSDFVNMMAMIAS